MNREAFIRTEQLIGEQALKRLAKSRVAVFGIGGVGGYVAEALARCGVGFLDLFDNDVVSESNLNRQIIALHSTLGAYKVDVMKTRIADICPAIQVRAHRCFYMPENADMYPFSAYDYVVDAVDTVTAKLTIIERAKAANISVISCMGTGNKLDASKLQVTDITKTDTCPLARVMRKELRDRGIDHLKVLFSSEPPRKPKTESLNEAGKHPPASIAFVPATAGLLIANEVIRDLIAIT